MDKCLFLKVLHKYLKGNATHEERQFLYTYYNLFENEPDIVALWSKDQKEYLQDQMQMAIWETINSHEDQDQKVRPIYRRWITKVVAVALILVICTLAFILMAEKTPATKIPVRADQKATNDNSSVSWKEQGLFVENATMGEAAQLLEKRFNVHIIFNNEQIRANRFTTILKGQSLEQVLKSICEITGAVYSYNNEKGTVLINSKITTL